MPFPSGTPHQNRVPTGTPQGTHQKIKFTIQDEQDLRKTQVTKGGRQWCWYWFSPRADGTKQRHRAYGGTFAQLSPARKDAYYVNRERYWERKIRKAARIEHAELDH